MTLAPGTHLGPYEIQSALGAGGMGEVYRARDTRLHRDVAIKVLPEAFAADPDRLARFDREAKILASLNHPHIAGIHGIGDDARRDDSRHRRLHESRAGQGARSGQAQRRLGLRLRPVRDAHRPARLRRRRCQRYPRCHSARRARLERAAERPASGDRN